MFLGLRCPQDGQRHDSDMLTPYPAIKSISARAKSAGLSERDTILFVLAILHERANFSLRLPGQGHSHAAFGQGVDGAL